MLLKFWVFYEKFLNILVKKLQSSESYLLLLRLCVQFYTLEGNFVSFMFHTEGGDIFILREWKWNLLNIWQNSLHKLCCRILKIALKPHPPNSDIVVKILDLFFTIININPFLFGSRRHYPLSIAVACWKIEMLKWQHICIWQQFLLHLTVWWVWTEQLCWCWVDTEN